MKKLINKTIILSLFVALTGCNDWLDVSPKADMKAEDRSVLKPDSEMLW